MPPALKNHYKLTANDFGFRFHPFVVRSGLVGDALGFLHVSPHVSTVPQPSEAPAASVRPGNRPR